MGWDIISLRAAPDKAPTIFCIWVARGRERKNARNEMHWVLSQRKKNLLKVLPLPTGTQIKRSLDGDI